ncbi:MAG: 4Fe-4S binding protein [Coriobacteriales bacterium]|jgi:Fe-S-cluster-containing hydrogenase component 2|nr:4Fe-4S binding protein [Coriobacteriales bacterium]
MAVQISDDCIGCSACVNECPQGAIEIQDGQAVVDEATCVECGICVDACPASAITL